MLLLLALPCAHDEDGCEVKRVWRMSRPLGDSELGHNLVAEYQSRCAARNNVFPCQPLIGCGSKAGWDSSRDNNSSPFQDFDEIGGLEWVTVER